MKKSLNADASGFQRRDENGVAIITVMSVLMLMTVMVVSFFTMATNELRSSRSTADGLRAIVAKDIAINLAIAQIREATTREGTIWVSQPGAIRVYGRTSNSGRASSIYKLYSSNQMIAGSMRDIRRDQAQDWNLRPAQYVDLNRPVISPDPTDPENIARASLHFPIVDPRAYNGVGQPGSIEGFSYEPGGVQGIVADGADHFKRLPMPVQWLYILADGSIGYLDGKNRFVGAVKPTEGNPITSRIAFWTDDESCKVNVNTASEGVFWDTPRVDTSEERLYATHQPQTGEFQRYPGHPAQTCLSTVLFPNEGLGYKGRLDPGAESDIEKMEALWTIAPGISTGGSKGGTVQITDTMAEGLLPTPQKYHLYTSPEEILFDSHLSEGKRLRHPQISSERLETAGFFLTARSRAPETTLLGYPRMSMWPIANHFVLGTRFQSAFDRAIAFCSTINKRAYFYQREPTSAKSGHSDFYRSAEGRNLQLFEAYKRLMDDPVPGFRASFGDKYGSGRFDDRDNLLAETFDYFRAIDMTGNSGRLGFSSGIDGTHGSGQVSAICMCGGIGSGFHDRRWSDSRLQLPMGFGRMLGLSEFAIMLVKRAEWKLPDPEHPKGEFIGDASENGDKDAVWKNGGQMTLGTQLIQLGMVVECFAAAHGWRSLQPMNAILLRGGTGNEESEVPDTFTLGGYKLEPEGGSHTDYPKAAVTRFPDLSSNVQSIGLHVVERPENWIAWGGYGGIRVFKNMITFEPVVVPGTEKTIEFGGSTRRDPVRILLYSRNRGTGGRADLTTDLSSSRWVNLIQSYQLAFPRAKFPVPKWWPGPGSTSTSEWYGFKDRMANAIAIGTDWLYSKSSDVIHSLVPNHSDYRLLAGKRVVGPGSFVPHPGYGGGNRMAHSLTDYVDSQSNGVQLLPGGSFGEPFLGLSYPQGVAPDFPIGPSNEKFASDVNSRAGIRRPFDPQSTGDFDNGVGNAPDGPYINKPDDGDTRGLGSSKDPYFDSIREPRERIAAMYSPNRLIPSPGMLGSLSTGVQSNVPWQTLLFRPMDPTRHFGAREDPPDHLWMDYFWMPVVQPYVISEPFSTAGKINMNFQILPFTYIRRATGLHAVMKAEKMLAIPTSAVGAYKTGAGNAKWRKFIDIEETLKQWDEKFDSGEAFRSATEICDMYLVPEGETWDGRPAMDSFWDRHKLTGDNTKERPYTNIYPRLTVRSNTFKVHIVAQSITKGKGTEPDRFDGRRDKIVGEYRGSAVIERAIAPNDKDLPNYAEEIAEGGTPETLDLFYSYRIVNEKRFAR